MGTEFESESKVSPVRQRDESGGRSDDVAMVAERGRGRMRMGPRVTVLLLSELEGCGMALVGEERRRWGYRDVEESLCGSC